MDLTLLKGAGPEKPDEKTVWCLPKTKGSAKALGALARRNGYVVEQWSSFPSILAWIRANQPAVVFTSDANLCFLLHRTKRFATSPYCILFSNGGPCGPPFSRMDAVHQVAPTHLQVALEAGEPASKHYFVPYGIDVPEGAPNCDPLQKLNLRQKLDLPPSRTIVLSVGWISATHKRMDHLVNEVSEVRCQRAEVRDSAPYLVMLGAMDASSEEVMALARGKLRDENFAARSVPYEQVADYYRAADLFVLASLKEGFGRVFMEALIHGLPVIAHDYPVMRFVLGDEGIFGDLSKEGTLTDLIEQQVETPTTPEDAARRRESVRQRFSWPVLAPQYRDMFFDCFEKVQPL